MMCFFVSVYSITCRNNISISTFGGGFRWQSEYPKIKKTIFNKNRGKQKKSNGKTGIFTQNYSNSINNHCKYLKISPNCR
ncbi:Uncharacterized protein FWK35_00008362 [Aphis craccivora]|uniref:Uncharacterized protein n=1 Tax=Aphis craccivora TaxID=307492 RepID=A0A6G0YJS3_APHCR|nr:Uncharacterized protein FWK35_00008362 [Aphis craccivora]